MSTILVYAPRPEIGQDVTEALTVARSLGEPVLVMLAHPAQASLDAAREQGVSQVLVAVPASPGPAAAQESHLPDLPPVAGQVLAAAVTRVGADVVLIPSSFAGKEAAADAAVRLDAGLLIDVGDLRREGGELVGAKAVFAGTWRTEAAVTTPRAVVTLRPNVTVAKAAQAPGAAEVIELPVAASMPGGLKVLARTERVSTGRPELAQAAYVVAGGRGTYGDFGPVAELADVLGAAIGTTRDCVEEGWIEHDLQIGQTGVTIAPRLYIGAGVSGAPHHHGGMQASQTIVAVNIEEDSPQVQIADFAVIGDAASVLTDAAQALRDHKEQQARGTG